MTKEEIYLFQTERLVKKLADAGFKLPEFRYGQHEGWTTALEFGNGMNLTIKRRASETRLGKPWLRKDVLELLVEQAIVLNDTDLYHGTFRFFENHATYTFELYAGDIPNYMQKYSEHKHYSTEEIMDELVELVRTESEKKKRNEYEMKMEMKLEK